MSRSIKERILEKVNEIPTEGALSDDNSILNSWNHNLWKVASVLPHGDMLAVSNTPNTWDSLNSVVHADKNAYNKILLLVERHNGDNIYRPVKEIQLSQAPSAQDDESMFYATAHTPVYWIENVVGTETLDGVSNAPADAETNPWTYNYISDIPKGQTESGTDADITITGGTSGAIAQAGNWTKSGATVEFAADVLDNNESFTIDFLVEDTVPSQQIYVFPEADSGTVRVHSFAKQKWDTSTPNYDYITYSDVLYFPDHAIEVTVLLTAVDLLKELMALKALEDEDAEIVQMITAQIQSLEASINKEMEFLRKDITVETPNEN